MAVNILLKRSSTPNKRPDPTLMLDGEVDLNYDAVTGGLFYRNSDGDLVKAGPVQVSATAPNSTPAGSPGNSLGELWFNTTSNGLFIWNGTVWVDTTLGVAVQGVTGTSPITVDNTDPLNPVIGIDAATTSSPGAVQLATDVEVQAGTDTEHAVVPSSLQSKISDSTSTTSSTTIASSTAVKAAYDLGDAAMPKAGGTFTGDVIFDNAVTLTMDAGSIFLMDGTSSFSGSTTFEGSSSTTFSTGSTVNFQSSPTFESSLTIGTSGTTYTLPSADGNANYILATDGSGNVSWVDNSAGDVTGVTGTAPITVDNTDPQNPVVGVEAASTSQAGVVQLYNDVDSTSTTEAATANAVKIAYDAATAASAAGLPTSGGTMTGNITFSAGTTIEYADVTAGTVVAADQLAVVVDATNGLLTVVTDFDAGFYTTSGDGGGVSVEVG